MASPSVPVPTSPPAELRLFRQVLLTFVLLVAVLVAIAGRAPDGGGVAAGGAGAAAPSNPVGATVVVDRVGPPAPGVLR